MPKPIDCRIITSEEWNQIASITKSVLGEEPLLRTLADGHQYLRINRDGGYVALKPHRDSCNWVVFNAIETPLIEKMIQRALDIEQPTLIYHNLSGMISHGIWQTAREKAERLLKRFY